MKLKLIKTFQQTKVQDQMASQVNSIKHLEEANTCTSQNLPKNCRGRNTPKLILQGQHHPDTKSRQRYHMKRKLKANITDEHRRRNPEQNSSKQNPIAHLKYYTP